MSQPAFESKAASISQDVKDVKTVNDDLVVEDHDLGVTRKISASLAIDPEAEKRLVRKFDFRILPCLALMYLFNSLDKSNLGNAKTAGLEASLKLKGNQYNLLVSLFYIPYVLTAPFLAIIGKKYGPNRVLPLMMTTFGTATLLVVTVTNFGGLLAIRWILGMAESAFFPLVIYYQTTFYRRGELARRLAIFYAASSIASAFGGLLAFGTFQIHSGSLAPWRYLFIIEGSCTVLFSFFALWWLPYNAESAKFLTPEEKQLAHYRMQVDSSSEVNQAFKFREAVKILKHPTSWLILGIQICLGVPLQSVSLFLPVIISRLGYSTVKTNLYTVAPNITGACMLLLLAFASDLTKIRFPFVALGFAFTCTGFIIFAAVNITTQLNVAYFACFMMTWGTSAPSVILDVWYNNNIADEGKRVLLTSLAVPMANSMGLLSGNIFFPSEKPKYQTALATTAAFGATGCLLTLILGAWMIIDNKKRDKKQGVKMNARDVPTELLASGPASGDYRWQL